MLEVNHDYSPHTILEVSRNYRARPVRVMSKS